jgi:hypothetical protein
MNLGAEPKKVAILGVLVVGAIGGLYLNSGSSTPAPVARTTAPVITTSSAVRSVMKTTKGQTASQSNGGEYRPRVLGSRPDDVLPTDVDPELKLDLLARVQAVEPIEAGRNLFQYGAAPPPPAPITLPKDVRKIEIAKPPAPVTTTQVLGESRTVPPPPPTPINLKYYGYVVSKTDGRKEACLLDGEDIILATENETVKQRYKIVRIALTSIVIEDTQAKDTQTLKFQDLPSS